MKDFDFNYDKLVEIPCVKLKPQLLPLEFGLDAGLDISFDSLFSGDPIN